MNTAAAENRQYAGPFSAAELQVSEGSFATVMHRDLSDEQAAALGYVFDADEAVEQGKTFAHRTITVSAELADALGDSEAWPRVGGTANADNALDDPSHPARQTYETFDGERLSPGELNERVRVAAEADDAAELDAEEAEQRRVAEQREALRIAGERRHGEVVARIAELEAARKSAQALADDGDAPADDREQADDDVSKIDAELAELADERKRLEGNG